MSEYQTDPNAPATGYAAFSPSCGEIVSVGLTKREYFAAKAMQALAANPETDFAEFSEVASDAVRMADALIKALNQEEKPVFPHPAEALRGTPKT